MRVVIRSYYDFVSANFGVTALVQLGTFCVPVIVLSLFLFDINTKTPITSESCIIVGGGVEWSGMEREGGRAGVGVLYSVREVNAQPREIVLFAYLANGERIRFARR